MVHARLVHECSTVVRWGGSDTDFGGAPRRPWAGCATCGVFRGCNRAATGKERWESALVLRLWWRSVEGAPCRVRTLANTVFDRVQALFALLGTQGCRNNLHSVHTS